MYESSNVSEEQSVVITLYQQGSDKKHSKEDYKLAVSAIQQEVDRMNKAEKGLSTEAVPLSLGSYHYVRSSALAGGGPVQKRLDLSLEDAQKTLSKIDHRSKISSELFAKVTDLLCYGGEMYLCMCMKLCVRTYVVYM